MRALERGYNQYPDILEEMLYSNIILAFIQNYVCTNTVHCIKCTLCEYFCNVGKAVLVVYIENWPRNLVPAGSAFVIFDGRRMYIHVQSLYVVCALQPRGKPLH